MVGNRLKTACAMLIPKVQLNLKNARDYFREHLSVGDYCAEGQTISGKWIGRGAAMLGLEGRVREKEFLDLSGGLDPQSGERLTARLNSTRANGEAVESNRRIFYDFTISPPKSVSVVAMYQVSRVIELHNQAVRVAMSELEAFAEARIRIGGQRSQRVTANTVAACFRHDTSRELDPHLQTLGGVQCDFRCYGESVKGARAGRPVPGSEVRGKPVLPWYGEWTPGSGVRDRKQSE